MENNLILKIAAGVFLGIAAWTYRSELGDAAIYMAVIAIALFLLIYLYRLISSPIKTAIQERSVDALVQDFYKNGLIERSLVGAAQEGLKRFYYEQTRTDLARLMASIKEKRKNQIATDVEEQKIQDLLLEIVDDFKHSYVKASP
jgi:flagellar biosynthesis protein FliP